MVRQVGNVVWVDYVSEYTSSATTFDCPTIILNMTIMQRLESGLGNQPSSIEWPSTLSYWQRCIYVM